MAARVSYTSIRGVRPPSWALAPSTVTRRTPQSSFVQLRQAHGVYQGLTESRIQTPWIEAFRKKEAGHLPSPRSPGERDLSPRKMSDSYHQVELPLAKEPWLSDTYLNATGRIRLGTLFMDLDALAGIISYKHTGEDVTVVTAAVDRITIDDPPTELCDLVYSGQVTYATGRSSMEITCRVSRARPDGQQPKDEDHFITCMFTMVALDPATKKSVLAEPPRSTSLPPITTANEHEKHLFSLGESRSKQKKELSASRLLQQPPTAAESSLIHRIWQRQLAYHDPNNPSRLPPNARYMSHTRLDDTSIMQPQFRNRHQFQVFGGFLMRHAYELAFSCCASFARKRPSFVSLDPSTFMNPVPVGSVLYLTAVVAYTDPPLVDDEGHADTQTSSDSSSAPKQTRVQVRVDTKVRNIEHETSKPTGQFNYTFTVDADVKVIPQTYSEFMQYIDAKRRAEQAERVAEAGETKTPQREESRITE